jgi:phosphoribosyl-ATP pyrophosphohydrolase/phosphoribosyl-AMP cyclohydrolase
MTEFKRPSIDWEKINGLLPVIIQDNQTSQVLMLGYMNQDALRATYETGRVTFYTENSADLFV